MNQPHPDQRFNVTYNELKGLFNAGAHWATASYNPDEAWATVLKKSIPEWATHYAEGECYPMKMQEIK